MVYSPREEKGNEATLACTPAAPPLQREPAEEVATAVDVLQPHQEEVRVR